MFLLIHELKTFVKKVIKLYYCAVSLYELTEVQPLSLKLKFLNLQRKIIYQRAKNIQHVLKVASRLKLHAKLFHVQLIHFQVVAEVLIHQ